MHLQCAGSGRSSSVAHRHYTGRSSRAAGDTSRSRHRARRFPEPTRAILWTCSFGAGLNLDPRWDSWVTTWVPTVLVHFPCALCFSGASDASLLTLRRGNLGPPSWPRHHVSLHALKARGRGLRVRARAREIPPPPSGNPGLSRSGFPQSPSLPWVIDIGISIIHTPSSSHSLLPAIDPAVTAPGAPTIRLHATQVG